MGKRLKTGEKPNEYKVTNQDEDLFTDFERVASTGRFLLEKKSRFSLQAHSKVVSCDISHSNDSQVILVIGQSNGVFSLYNLDTL